MPILYTIVEDRKTNECHIFYSAKTPTECQIENKSIYEKCTYHNELYSIEKAECVNEQIIRDIAAKMGRQVCGICISHLYASY